MREREGGKKMRVFVCINGGGGGRKKKGGGGHVRESWSMKDL